MRGWVRPQSPNAGFCGTSGAPFGRGIGSRSSDEGRTHLRNRAQLRPTRSNGVTRSAPKGLLSEAALAWVISSKYLDGLPLYRQAALLGRFGGTDLSRNTLAASVVRVGQAVQPVINLLRDLLLEAPVVFGDETEVQVLKEAGRRAQARSYMWAQMTRASGQEGTGPPIRLFAYAPSRGAEAARRLYAGMRSGGVLMSDGYEPYNAIAAEHGLVHLGCWAHCRRYFNDALQALPKDRRGPEQLPAKFLQLIARLYQVEAEAHEAGLDVTALRARRDERSVAVLDELHKLLLAHLHGVLPASLLGKALHYMAAQWPNLARYVEDGPLRIGGCVHLDREARLARKGFIERCQEVLF